MPIVKVDMVGKQDPQVKKEFMEFVADLVCSNTSTLKKTSLFTSTNEILKTVEKHLPLL